MSDLRLVLRGVMAQWLSLATRGVFAIILVPIVLHELGAESYGVVVLVGVIVALSQLIDLGFGQALSRELTEHRIKGDNELRGNVTSTGLFFYMLMACVISSILVINADAVLSSIGIGENLLKVGKLLLFAYALPILSISLLTPPFAANLISYNRFDVLRAIELAVTIVNGVVLITLLPIVDNKIVAWISVTTSVRVLGFVATIIMAKTICGNLGISIFRVRFFRFFEVIKLGLQMYIMQLATMLTDKSDPIILSHFRGESSVSVYQPATQVSIMLRPLVGSLANQLHPSTTASYVGGDSGGMRELMVLGTRYTLLVGIGVCVIGIAFSNQFCELWLGKSLGEEVLTASWVMKGWLLVDLSQYLGGVQWAVLVAMKRIRVMVVAMLCASIVNIAVTYLLMKYTDLGIAWVTLPTIVVTMIIRPCLAIYACRQCGLSVGAYWSRGYARPIWVGLILALFCMFINVVIIVDNWFSLVTVGASAGICWLLLLWKLGLSKEERMVILSKMPFKKPLI